MCDRCGGRLVQREDDRPDSIRVRMGAYEETTRPLIGYYQGRGKLLTIPATGTPGEILERSLALLGDRRTTGRSPTEPSTSRRPPIVRQGLGSHLTAGSWRMQSPGSRSDP